MVLLKSAFDVAASLLRLILLLPLLGLIAQHRPLAQINDPEQRAEAEQVRVWFAEEFLDALAKSS